jgi:hypothetical protein
MLEQYSGRPNKMSIIFLCKTPTHGSTNFRGYQLVNEINARYPGLAEILIGDDIAKVLDAEHQLLVPILTIGDGLWEYFDAPKLERLKKNGNLVYADILDSFCWPEYNPLLTNTHHELFSLLDGLIVYSQRVKAVLDGYFKAVDVRVIHHQWDREYNFFGDLKREIRKNSRVIYSGTRDGFQLEQSEFSRHVDFVFNTKEKSTQLKYRHHISFRHSNSLHSLFKPAAKLATASAVKALLFTSEDASVRDILGSSWPLYFSSRGEFLEKYDHLMRAPDLETSLLAYVENVIRQKLSPENIANEFVTLYFERGPKCAE